MKSNDQRRKEMTEVSYGNWTAIKRQRGYTIRCQCGFSKDVNKIGTLRNGTSTQCRSCYIKKIAVRHSAHYGKWTVEKKQSGYTIKCECGFSRNVDRIGDLISGKSTQCIECYNRKRIAYNRTHGLSGSKIFRTWMSMKDRCLNKRCKDYKYYGGRGISIAEEWLSFDNFYKDMGDKPDGFQIDRIDNNEGYFKDNCRWVTPKENCNNRRRSGPFKKNNQS